MAYVRTAKTSSGAMPMQIVVAPAGARKIEHLGSAHDDADVAALKGAAAQRLAAGQVQLDLGLAVRSASAKDAPILDTVKHTTLDGACRPEQAREGGADKENGS